jgi:hypothetical protein
LYQIYHVPQNENLTNRRKYRIKEEDFRPLKNHNSITRKIY